MTACGGSETTATNDEKYEDTVDKDNEEETKEKEKKEKEAREEETREEETACRTNDNGTEISSSTNQTAEKDIENSIGELEPESEISVEEVTWYHQNIDEIDTLGERTECKGIQYTKDENGKITNNYAYMDIPIIKSKISSECAEEGYKNEILEITFDLSGWYSSYRNMNFCISVFDAKTGGGICSLKDVENLGIEEDTYFEYEFTVKSNDKRGDLIVTTHCPIDYNSTVFAIYTNTPEGYNDDSEVQLEDLYSSIDECETLKGIMSFILTICINVLAVLCYL